MQRLLMSITLGVLVVACMGCSGACCPSNSARGRQAPAEALAGPSTRMALFMCPNGVTNEAMLNEIRLLANRSGQRQIIPLADRCQLHTPAFTGSTSSHCAYIQRALTAARGGNWALCASELEHGPGVGPEGDGDS